MVELDPSELRHQRNYEWLRYGLTLADRHRPVRVGERARSPRDKPVAFGLLHGRQHALRKALGSGKARFESRVGADGFKHRGALANAWSMLRRCVRCEDHQRERKPISDHTVGTSTPAIDGQAANVAVPGGLGGCYFF